jgi:hypothetical protein
MPKARPLIEAQYTCAIVGEMENKEKRAIKSFKD